MHAMQYHVKLPSDYNMEIIRDRVRLNGYKTDGFKNLIIKAYLISQTTSNCITNTYSPLYLWRSSEGWLNLYSMDFMIMLFLLLDGKI